MLAALARKDERILIIFSEFCDPRTLYSYNLIGPSISVVALQLLPDLVAELSLVWKSGQG